MFNFVQRHRGTYNSHLIKDQTASTLFRSVACYWSSVKFVHQWSYYLLYVVQTLTANLHICIEGQVFHILFKIKKQFFWWILCIRRSTFTEKQITDRKSNSAFVVFHLCLLKTCIFEREIFPPRYNLTQLLLLLLLERKMLLFMILQSNTMTDRKFSNKLGLTGDIAGLIWKRQEPYSKINS